MKNKTVKEILTDYLKKNNFDGLINFDHDCGCDLDCLQDCDGYCLECQPAYKVKPSKEFIAEWGEVDFMMTLSKKGRLKRARKWGVKK